MEDATLKLPAGMAEFIKLGQVLGQNEAFGIVAGRCTAAQAAGLYRLREDKTFQLCGMKWEEFCPAFLNMCRAEADRIIHNWQEFGAGYFELSQFTRVSPDTYRAIAPSIQNGALFHNGEPIELSTENSRKVVAAVAELRRALVSKKPAAKKPPRQLEPHERIAELDNRCAAVESEFRELASKEQYGEYRLQLTSVLMRHQTAIGRLFLENGLS
jgi:hypothetical protein